MEKPIVRENLMAMCESVATTCCYAVSGTAPLSFAATLHGGKLKCEYVYAYYAKGSDTPLGDSWLNWTRQRRICSELPARAGERELVYSTAKHQ